MHGESFDKEMKSAKLALLLLLLGALLAALLSFFVHPALEGELKALESKVSLLFGGAFALLGLSAYLLGHLLLKGIEAKKESEEKEELGDQGF